MPAIAAAAIAAPAAAAVITPTDVDATSWWNTTVEPINLVNGNGLTDTGDPLTSTHSTDGNAVGMWHAAVGQNSEGPPPVVADQELEFDLGGTYDLTGAYIWQFNQTGNLQRGVRDFTILVSTNGGVSYDTTVGTFSLAQGGGTPAEPVQVIDFGSTFLGVTHIQFDLVAAHSNNATEYVGLSEVKFEGTLVPEPGSLALIGFGGLLMLRRRRS